MRDPAPLFINALNQLESGRRRAALAALRGSLREGRALEAAPYVLPFGVESSDEESALLVAGLFALHPEVGTASIADALRTTKTRRNSDSIEPRFRALLSASRSDLPVLLRHAVSLVASEGIGLNWTDLYWAVRVWDRGERELGERHPRRQWARDFWADEGLAVASSANS